MFGWTIFWEVLGPIVREQWIHQSKRVLGADCITQTLSTGADDSGCSSLLYSRLGVNRLPIPQGHSQEVPGQPGEPNTPIPSPGEDPPTVIIHPNIYSTCLRIFWFTP